MSAERRIVEVGEGGRIVRVGRVRRGQVWRVVGPAGDVVQFSITGFTSMGGRWRAVGTNERGRRVTHVCRTLESGTYGATLVHEPAA